MEKLLAIILFQIFLPINAQSQLDTLKKTKILKVSYNAYPISTYDSPPKESVNFKNIGEIVSLANSYEHKYSLYINLNTNESIYCLDTLIINKKPDQEKVNFMINNNLDFVIKNKVDKTFKYERIFERKFYSEGDIKNIEWTITKEYKNISGYNCQKAIAKNDGLLLNVWFTEELPVPAGPVNYFGLPGLIIWSEDFFWTTEIQKIEYSNESFFDILMSKYLTKFEKDKKGSEIKEPLLIIKKCGLVKSMIDQMKN